MFSAKRASVRVSAYACSAAFSSLPPPRRPPYFAATDDAHSHQILTLTRSQTWLFTQKCFGLSAAPSLTRQKCGIHVSRSRSACETKRVPFRQNILYVTINLPDIKEDTFKYELTPTSLSFAAQAGT